MVFLLNDTFTVENMGILRKLYYFINPEMRLWIRKIYFLPHTIFSENTELAPPKSLIYTGSGDFLKQGKEWKDFFQEQGLKPEHSFLDIGSGIGRIALGLVNFLKGEYKGFEAMEIGAKWCQKNISPKFPNFDFKFVDLHNDLYNSDGINSAEYKFDYPAEFFDFACSISVFTHMIDTEVDNYLQETAKVMK